jgi:glycosyltransferase involved in cell wall biosynthesis
MQTGIKSSMPADTGINRINDNVDISVILPFHNEGSLAHRTLRGLETCVQFTLEQELSVETVILLDRVTDEKLRETIFRWKPRLGNCQVFQVDYGSLSLTRNYGISKSKGTFIALLDGDDLFCKDWLAKAFQACSVTCAIAHPELNYYFPLNNYLFINQRMSEYRTLIQHNLWSVLIMAPKSVFEKIPYRADTECFGFEDWLWNCETVAEGFGHVAVPQTVIAVRQKTASESLCQYSIMKDKVVAPNSLFRAILSEPYLRNKRDDPNELETSSGKMLSEKTSPLPKIKYDETLIIENYSDTIKNNATLMENFYGQLKSLPFHPRLRFIRDTLSPKYRRAIREMLSLTKQLISILITLLRSSLDPALQETAWLREKLLDLAQIEPEVRFFGPLRRETPKSKIHKCITPEMGSLLQAKKARVFITPWLIKGGADLVALNYMNAVNENVFLITTSPAHNAFLNFLPSNAVHIDIGNTNLSYEERKLLLHRLLLEADFDFIHVINSREAFDIFVKYRHTFTGRRIFASFFGIEPVQGFELGYAVEHFPRLLDFFERISTDNQSFKNRLEELYELPQDLIAVHKMPFSPPHYDMKFGGGPTRDQNGSGNTVESPFRVFYAGRLAPEKRPEIAIRAVEALILEGEKVTLDVWGEPSSNFKMDFPNTSNIKLRGAFDGIASVRPTEYDVMILPSASEGLPNVVIECMGNGVPVIASNVGGVGEIVTDETGWLVDDHNNPAAFQAALKVLLRDKKSIERKGRAARKFVLDHHSWSGFEAQAREFYRLGA